MLHWVSAYRCSKKSFGLVELTQENTLQLGTYPQLENTTLQLGTYPQLENTLQLGFCRLARDMTKDDRNALDQRQVGHVIKKVALTYWVSVDRIFYTEL